MVEKYGFLNLFEIVGSWHIEGLKFKNLIHTLQPAHEERLGIALITYDLQAEQRYKCNSLPVHSLPLIQTGNVQIDDLNVNKLNV